MAGCLAELEVDYRLELDDSRERICLCTPRRSYVFYVLLTGSLSVLISCRTIRGVRQARRTIQKGRAKKWYALKGLASWLSPMEKLSVLIVLREFIRNIP